MGKSANMPPANGNRNISNGISKKESSDSLNTFNHKGLKMYIDHENVDDTMD